MSIRTTLETIRHVLELWLLLAAMAFLCVSFTGAHDYQNSYWLFTIGCWLLLDLSWALAGRHTRLGVAGSSRWMSCLLTFLPYALYCLSLSSLPLRGEHCANRVLRRVYAL